MTTEPIVRLASRGDGIAESGRYAALAAPGDLLQADGKVTAGPHHATAACRHFPDCGGCQLQHVDDASLSAFVTERIGSALLAQGIAGVRLLSPQMSPPQSRRRVSLRAERRGRQILLGFNAAKSNRVIDLAQCPVMHPALEALLKPLRSFLAQLVPDRRSANIRMTMTDQGVDLLIAGVEAEGLAAADAMTRFAETHKLARLSIDEGFGPSPRWEPDPVTVTLGGVAVALPEGAFLQATTDGEASLAEAVRRIAAGSEKTADLFAGLGTFALSLPGHIVAVEGARDAILALQMSANRAGRSIVTEHRDLFRRPLSAADLAGFSCVVLDPPRAGAKEQVAELAQSAVPAIAYVSCNPATFARDAAVLVSGGYRLDWIQPVGQFRWSTHVELAAAFIRT